MSEDSNSTCGRSKDAKQDRRTEPCHINYSSSQTRRRSVATSNSLFVTGFNSVINKAHIERLFSKFGTIERVSDFMTSQKSQRRFCFVQLDSTESAQKAMDNLNGRMLLSMRLVVQPATNNNDSSSHSSTKTKCTSAVKMNITKERIILDKKILALKKKIKDSNCNDES